MPTRNISLTAEQDAFVESEAVRDALRALQQRRREDALKLKALRAQIKAGVDALGPEISSRWTMPTSKGFSRG